MLQTNHRITALGQVTAFIKTFVIDSFHKIMLRSKNCSTSPCDAMPELFALGRRPYITISRGCQQDWRVLTSALKGFCCNAKGAGHSLVLANTRGECKGKKMLGSEKLS